MQNDEVSDPFSVSNSWSVIGLSMITTKLWPKHAKHK